ncbi:MAG: hypothetical protein FWE50_01995 [Alphaproteobacteria bacterium]|nr:hypothetical protein [Alphaproteobacteria bacterium]
MYDVKNLNFQPYSIGTQSLYFGQPVIDMDALHRLVNKFNITTYLQNIPVIFCKHNQENNAEIIETANFSNSNDLFERIKKDESILAFRVDTSKEIKFAYTLNKKDKDAYTPISVKFDNLGCHSRWCFCYLERAIDNIASLFTKPEKLFEAIHNPHREDGPILAKSPKKLPEIYYSLKKSSDPEEVYIPVTNIFSSLFGNLDNLEKFPGFKAVIQGAFMIDDYTCISRSGSIYNIVPRDIDISKYLLPDQKKVRYTFNEKREIVMSGTKYSYSKRSIIDKSYKGDPIYLSATNNTDISEHLLPGWTQVYGGFAYNGRLALVGQSFHGSQISTINNVNEVFRAIKDICDGHTRDQLMKDMMNNQEYWGQLRNLGILTYR